MLTAGIAGLAAGSMAMAAGEYVSVSSQVDVERGDRAKEQRELDTNPQSELAELAGIYRDRGLPDDLAHQVAQALHDADPLASHLRDELGHSEITALNSQIEPHEHDRSGDHWRPQAAQHVDVDEPDHDEQLHEGGETRALTPYLFCRLGGRLLIPVGPMGHSGALTRVKRPYRGDEGRRNLMCTAQSPKSGCSVKEE